MYLRIDAAKVAKPKPHDCPYTHCDTRFVGVYGAAWLWSDDTNFYRAIFCCDQCFLAAMPPAALPRA